MGVAVFSRFCAREQFRRDVAWIVACLFAGGRPRRAGILSAGEAAGFVRLCRAQATQGRLQAEEVRRPRGPRQADGCRDADGWKKLRSHRVAITIDYQNLDGDARGRDVFCCGHLGTTINFVHNHKISAVLKYRQAALAVIC